MSYSAPQAVPRMTVAPAVLRSAGVILSLAVSAHAAAAGDALRGARVFQACSACHTLESGRHTTGPSLAGIWGKKAGAAADFHRYSEPLKRSGIVWNEASLDKWIANPQAAVPGTLMTFPGISEAPIRADLIAFLRTATAGKAPARGGVSGHPDLKKSPPDARVAAIRHCADSYFVTTGTQQTIPFWEFNLRFKTDSGPSGPTVGQPVLVGQGMQGDRAQVVFSNPGEISSFIREKC